MNNENLTNAGKGRPKGSKNKVSVAVKEAVRLAAEGLGGTDRLVAWAKEDPLNERAFWTQIYTKLIAIDVNASGNLTVQWPLPKSPLDQ